MVAIKDVTDLVDETIRVLENSTWVPRIPDRSRGEHCLVTAMGTAYKNLFYITGKENNYSVYNKLSEVLNSLHNGVWNSIWNDHEARNKNHVIYELVKAKNLYRDYYSR